MHGSHCNACQHSTHHIDDGYSRLWSSHLRGQMRSAEGSAPLRGQLAAWVRECWKIFGGTLLLCCYVASLDVVSETAEADGSMKVWRSTPAFMAASIALGCIWCGVLHILWHVRVAWRWLYDATGAYACVGNLICCAAVFLLFCQVLS